MRGVSDRSAAADSAGRHPDFETLRKLAVIAGISAAILFVVAGLAFQFQLYGDSGLFSYAVAVQDSWAFHWHNISNRSTVYLFAHVPAEIYGRLTGSAWAAVQIYGLLFFGVQLLGLALTFWLDRTRNRILFAFACLSNAVVCPLIFGAPSEMWFAHAFFWPALAAAHCSPQKWSGLLSFALFLPLAFTHEGALIFLAAILLSVLLRKDELSRFLHLLLATVAVIAIWLFVRHTLRPDDYTARVMAAAASNVFNPALLLDRILLLLAATAICFLAAFYSLRRAGLSRAATVVFVLTLMALAAYWIAGTHELHTDHRYYLRTVVIVICPVLAMLATCTAFGGAPFKPAHVACTIPRTIVAGIGAQALSALLLLAVTIHGVETYRFAIAWREYLTVFRRIVVQSPSLGTPYANIDPDNPEFRGMPWFSTLPYLSVLVAPAYAPARLAVDPRSDYFWISCPDATASVQKASERGVPATSRKMIRDYNCKHRP